MITFKLGVKVENVSRLMFHAINLVDKIYEKYGYRTVVTSITDGKHSIGSLHYKGFAVDFRTYHIPSYEQQQAIAKEIDKILGENFDVVLEGNHIHIEYDDKLPF